MKKRSWLFALLLILCLMLTGCGNKTFTPSSVSDSVSAAVSAVDVPATVADFDAALKAAGFIDEDEYNAVYADRFSDDAALYQQFTQDGVVGLITPESMDAEYMNSSGIKESRFYQLGDMYMDNDDLMLSWDDAVVFLVFDSDASAESYFQSNISALSDYEVSPKVYASGNATRAEYRDGDNSTLASLKGNTILVYDYYYASSIVMDSVISDLGY